MAMIDPRRKRLNKDPEKVYLHANLRWWVDPTTFVGRTGFGSQATLPNDALELGEWVIKHLLDDDTNLVVSGNAAIDVTKTTEAYEVSGVVSPNVDNITIIANDGLYSKIYTTGGFLSGDGTQSSPLFVSGVSLTNVEVVNDFVDRNLLNATANEGDLVKVLNAYGPSIASTYVWDGSDWVEIEEFDTNLYNTSSALTSNRVASLWPYSLTFQGNVSELFISPAGYVGFNETSPATIVHITPETAGIDDPITIEGLITNNTPEDVLVPMVDGTIKKKSVFLLDTSVVTQVAHGFTLNANNPFRPVTFNGTIWQTANTTTTAAVHDAYIIEIIDADNFRIKESGYIKYAGHNLTVGQYYFSQDDGSIGTTADSDINDPVCFVIDNQTIQLIDNRPISALIGGGGTTITIINDLVDVDITGPVYGDILIYNDGGGEWENASWYRHVETGTDGQTTITVSPAALPTNSEMIHVYRNGIALAEPNYWTHNTLGTITLSSIDIDDGDILMVEWLV